MEHGTGERVEEESHTLLTMKTDVEKAVQSTAYDDMKVSPEINVNYIGEEPALEDVVRSEPALLVKGEVEQDGWQDIAERQYVQSASTSADIGSSNEFASIVDLDSVIKIKEEHGAIDIGPTVLQKMDTQYTTNQKDLSVVKAEHTINEDKINPLLCAGVKEEIIEDEWRGSATPQDSLMEQPAKCTALHSLRKECLETVCRVRLRRLDTFQCEVCDAVYVDAHTLLQHVRDVHGPGPKRSLDRHVKSPEISNVPQQCATGSEPRICDYCKKMFMNSQGLQQHIAHVHSSVSYKCHQCNKIFKCKRYLMKHNANVHTAVTSPVVYTCEYCHKTYKSKHALIYHIDVVHTKVRYKCSECNKEYKGKHLLQRHVKKVHSKEEHEGSKSTCDYCKKMFNDKDTIRRHIARVHLSRSYKCYQCNKIFKCKDYLMSHAANVHTAGLQIRTCEYCQKTFRTKSGLRQHTKSIHVAAHIHRCQRCDKNFKSSDMLQRHNTSIHGKPHKCQVCLKCYKTIYSLRRHFEKAHNSKDIQFQSDLLPHAMPDLRLTADVTDAAASTSKQQHNVDVVKEEPADGELELGPVVFQHMDCNYRPYKGEPQDGSGGLM